MADTWSKLTTADQSGQDTAPAPAQHYALSSPEPLSHPAPAPPPPPPRWAAGAVERGGGAALSARGPQAHLHSGQREGA